MKHLIFDTETTDLVHNTLRPTHKQPRIIEYYGCILDDEQDWKMVAELHQFLDPGVAVTDEITRITGITNDMVKGQPTFGQWHSSLSELMGGADVMVAHNLSYDKQVVTFEYKRIEQPIRFPARGICTVETTEHIKGYRLSLTNLHEHLFGEPFKGAHRADVDVAALARCYVELCKRGEI